MKVTNEMKNIISRRIGRLEHEECVKYEEEIRDIISKINEELLESDEAKMLIDASQALVKKIKAMMSVYPERNLQCSFDVGGIENQIRGGHLVYRNFGAASRSITDRYDSMRDEIILKLTYGSDFEEAKKILEEYGIEL